MVTGVETAGLILGSIPLVVSALEHYAEGIQTIVRWWRCKSEVANLIRILNVEQARFLNTCELLLEGLVSPSQLELLLQSPGGPQWKDTDLDQKLKRRLARSYSAYLRSIDDFASVLKELEAKLELGIDGKPRWTDYRSSKDQYKRVKFSLSKEAYKELLERIEKDNQFLASLTGQSLRLEPARRRRRRPNSDFNTIREHARDLYHVINRGWRCTCKPPHKASLRLDARIIDYDPGSPDVLEDPLAAGIIFKVVFANPASNLERKVPGPWSWQETEVQFLNPGRRDSEDLLTVEPQGQMQQRSPPTLQNPPIEPEYYDLKVGEVKHSNSSRNGGALITKNDRKAKSGKKAVSFAPSSSPRNPGHEVGSPTSNLKPNPLALKQTEGLCNAMQKCMNDALSRPNCSGYLLVEHHHKLGVYPCQDSHAVWGHENITSLAQLLSGKSLACSPLASVSGGGVLLTRANRLSLALTVAASVLQLYETPWLDEYWSKDDILINQKSSGNLHEQAYISKSFPESTVLPLNHQKSILPVWNITLFTLGIVLIELCLGQSLEKLRTPEDLGESGKATALTDIETARRLIDATYEEGGENYGDAVRRCIRCQFDSRETNLDNEEFRQKVYDGVIAPLEDDLKHFQGSYS